MDRPEHTVYLALGTNLGDKAINLQNVQEEIAAKVGTISAVSSVYETEPWGYQSLNSFYNMVICVETPLSPLLLLQATLAIEKKMGRLVKTSDVYRDRLIDIDLILYDDLVLNLPQLIIPHPLFHQRRFVLDPLNEIAPNFVHPVLKKTIGELTLINFSGAIIRS